MSVLNSMNVTTVLSNGYQGLMNSREQHQQASQDILRNTIDSINQSYVSSGSTQDRVTISSLSENITDSPSLERSLTDLNVAGTTYNASAKIVTAANSMFETMFSEFA